VLLLQLDAGQLILAGSVVCIEPIIEEFRGNWHVWQDVAQLVPWIEAILILLLQLRVALWRA